MLEGRPGVTVSRHVIADEAEAASRGMHGSPTILINGADPFAEPGQPASMSCRLDRGSDGRISGLPSAGQLRQAIEQGADFFSRRGSLPDVFLASKKPVHFRPGDALSGSHD